jgi:hypothetical protein
VAQRYVYQVINHTQKQLFFGTADIALDKELERLAKDPKGPGSGWKKGDYVQWRPLTEWMDEDTAKNLHRQLEAKNPNDFTVISTLKQ